MACCLTKKRLRFCFDFATGRTHQLLERENIFVSVTIKQIAELAGVSCGTVDRAIHNRGRVNPEVKERILALCKALNYKPSKAGQQLAMQRQNLKLGFLCPMSLTKALWPLVLEGVQDFIRDFEGNNISVLVRQFSTYSPEEQCLILDEFEREGIQGLVIVPLNVEAVRERLQHFNATGVSVVIINSIIDGFEPLAYVGSDYIRAGRTAAELFHLMVHDEKLQIAIFFGSRYMVSQQQRKAGLSLELESLDREFSIIGPTGITNLPDLAENKVVEVLEQHPEVNGIFTVGGNVGAVCRAISKMGLAGRIIHICYDISKVIVEYLENGSATVVIGQEAYKQGYYSLKILSEYILYGTPIEKKYIYTKNEIFVRHNCD